MTDTPSPGGGSRDDEIDKIAARMAEMIRTLKDGRWAINKGHFYAEIERIAEARERAAAEKMREVCANYCENVLAGNHPHLAGAYRHAAANLRGAIDVDEVLKGQP